MVKIYKMSDIKFIDYYNGKRVIEFSNNTSLRAEKFTDMTLVELLTENKKTKYSLK